MKDETDTYDFNSVEDTDEVEPGDLLHVLVAPAAARELGEERGVSRHVLHPLREAAGDSAQLKLLKRSCIQVC